MVKQKTALVLVITLLLSTLSVALPASFAGVIFRDVGDNHWALERIRYVSENQLMPGHPDGTFRPLETVTRLEALMALYRTLKFSGRIKTFSPVIALQKHWQVIESSKVPAYLAPYGSDVHTAVAFALDNGLITAVEASGLMASGQPARATKSDLVLYTGKAINLLEKNIMAQQIQAFSYKDAALIPVKILPYLGLLVQRGVIGSKGDSEGYFRANDLINRSVLTVFVTGLNTMLDKLPSGNLIDVTVIKSVPVEEGTIPTVPAEVVATPVKEPAALLVVSGTFEALSKTLGSGTETGAYRVITLLKEDGTRHYLRVFGVLQVHLADLTITLDQLPPGSRLIISYQGYDAKYIVAENTAQSTEQTSVQNAYGTLGALLISDLGSSLTLQRADGSRQTYPLASEVEVFLTEAQVPAMGSLAPDANFLQSLEAGVSELAPEGLYTLRLGQTVGVFIEGLRVVKIYVIVPGTGK